MAKKDKRFFCRKSDQSSLGLTGEAKVIVDKQTGVNYLFVTQGYGGGLTVLVDREGRPVITSLTSLED